VSRDPFFNFDARNHISKNKYCQVLSPKDCILIKCDVVISIFPDMQYATLRDMMSISVPVFY